jgi:REP element-mobilizing transposase RayT
MAIARRRLVNEKRAGFYHCISRCVRRSFLCGKDDYSGNDYEHRRGWVEERIKFLAQWFSVDVFAYAVMSNHLHVVLRNNPKRVRGWDDREVARRWLHIFPPRRDEHGQAVVTAAMVDGFLENRRRVLEVRKRLSSLSWFMKCLNEPIAKRANREDGCKGHFWQGRFYSQSLEDDGAIMACMAYVDLNPLRAGEVSAPEQAQFTSLRQRYLALQARQVLVELGDEAERLRAMQEMEVRRLKELAELDGWLGNVESLRGQASEERLALNGIAGKSGTDWVLGNLKLESYLELVDWTGKQIIASDKASLPKGMASMLQRMNLAVDDWVENIEIYKSLFKRAVAPVAKLDELASARGQRWLAGKTGAKQLYQAVDQ